MRASVNLNDMFITGSFRMVKIPMYYTKKSYKYIQSGKKSDKINFCERRVTVTCTQTFQLDIHIAVINHESRRLEPSIIEH